MLQDIHNPKLMIKRRDALKFGAAGAAALGGLAGLVLPGRSARADTATTCLTQGPYWVDEQLFRQDVRSDPTSGVVQAGLPLKLQFSVSRLTSGVPAPLVGAWVDIWHCGGAGTYSDAAANGTVGQRFLRGYQITDSHGMARFITIYPGWYVGRTVHIHFRIRVFSGTTVTQNFTSQVFFNDTISTAIFARMNSTYNTHSGSRTFNTADGIYNQAGPGGLVRQADDLSHAIASFNIKLDASQGSCGIKLRGYAPDGSEYAREDDHELDFGGGTPTLALRKLVEC